MRLITKDSKNWDRQPEAGNPNNSWTLLISPFWLSHETRPPYFRHMAIFVADFE
jgi:hypothetical protein